MLIDATFDAQTKVFTVHSDLQHYDEADPSHWARDIDIQLRFTDSVDYLNVDGLRFGFEVFQGDVLLASSFRPYDNETFLAVKTSFLLLEAVEGSEETDAIVRFVVEIDGEAYGVEEVFTWPRHPNEEYSLPGFVILGDE